MTHLTNSILSPVVRSILANTQGKEMVLSTFVHSVAPSGCNQDKLGQISHHAFSRLHDIDTGWHVIKFGCFFRRFKASIWFSLHIKWQWVCIQALGHNWFRMMENEIMVDLRRNPKALFTIKVPNIPTAAVRPSHSFTCLKLESNANFILTVPTQL